MTDTICDHALAECRNRYGFTPSAWDADLAVLDIIEGRSRFLYRQPNGREKHVVQLGFVHVLAVYDPEDACIVTVLTPPKER